MGRMVVMKVMVAYLSETCSDSNSQCPEKCMFLSQHQTKLLVVMTSCRKLVGFFAVAFTLFLGTGQATAQTAWNVLSGNWTGTPANWSPAVVPNGVGAVITRTGATSTITQNLAGATVGTISLTGSTNGSWTFILTNSLTLNQDTG